MKKGYLYIAITTVLFSTMEIALKSASGDFNAIQLTFSRFLVGGIILIPVAISAIRKRSVIITARDCGTFALLGFCCVVVSMTLYQLAVTHTDASAVAVLFSSNPIFVMVFAYFFLHEAVHRNNIVALALEIIGILIIVNPFNTHLSISGIMFTLLSAITFALYGALSKRKCARFSGEVVTCFGFLFGGLELLAIALLGNIAPIASLFSACGLDVFTNVPILSGYTTGNLADIIYVFVGVTGIGYACYFKAMEETSANTASLVFFFKPVLAPILAFLILGENIPATMIAGIMLILAGSLTSILPPLLTQLRADAQPRLNENTKAGAPHVGKHSADTPANEGVGA